MCNIIIKFSRKKCSINLDSDTSRGKLSRTDKLIPEEIPECMKVLTRRKYFIGSDLEIRVFAFLKNVSW